MGGNQKNNFILKHINVVKSVVTQIFGCLSENFKLSLNWIQEYSVDDNTEDKGLADFMMYVIDC